MRITGRRRGRLLRELANASGDLHAIAARHRTTSERLAAWLEEPANRLALAQMCRAADVQAELTLSRYRLHAASRLVRLATADAACKGDETIRRACRDVLRTQPPGALGAVDTEALSEDEAMRQMLEALNQPMPEDEGDDGDLY